MKVRITLFVLFLSLVAYNSNAQIYAVVNGTWDNSGTSGNDIWSTNKSAVSGTVGLRPSATDDVYTNGKNITVSAGTCRNLFVSHSTSNSLTIGNGRTLTITGTMTGWDDANGLEEIPVPDAIAYGGTTSTLAFTGANLDTNYSPYVIFFWDSSVPLGRTFFNFSSGTYSTLFDVAFSRTLRIQSGTYSMEPSAFISGTTASSLLQIDAGATLRANNNSIAGFPSISVSGSLITSNSISGVNTFTITTGGSVNASASTISGTTLAVSGTLTSSSAITLTGDFAVNSGGTVNSSAAISSLNATITGTLITSSSFTTSGNLTINSGGHLSTSYSGTQGWWSGTSVPGSLTVDPASTVTISSNSAQNLYAQEYGNLTLSGSGAKTVTGSGTLNVKGNLSVGSAFNSDAAAALLIGGNLSNNASWTPVDEVTFNGTGAQQIGGTVLPTFIGGLEVNKASGTLALLRSIQVSTLLTISQGTFDASNYTTTLSGNLNNNGTLTFGTGASLGTLVIDGTASVSGTVPSFGHLTINPTRSFTSTGTVNVAGNISNNGTFNVGGLALNGTSAQTISGTLALANLIIRDGASVSNLGIINMSTSGLVTLEGNGTFNAGSGGGTNTLRLQSSSLSNGARIATLPNPDAFTGNVTVERYISAPEDWEYLAFPVTSPNVGMLTDDISVTGNFSDASPVGGNVVSSSSPSIYYLNAGWQAVGSGGSTASTSLSGTIGYSIWSYISSNVRLDVDGEIGKGPKGVAIRSGDNLIPNPYPSAIDWDLVNVTGANLSSNTIYVRTANGQYASYSGGMATGNHPLGSGWGGQLATGQAFWVLGAGSGTLTFQEDDKTSSTNFVREIQPKDFIRIRLTKDTLSDDAIVHFKETATIGKDVEFDAPKKLNDLALNISTYNDDPSNHFAINGVPFIGCEFTAKVRLGANNPEGNYSLSFEDLSSMTTGYDIVLLDKYLGASEAIDEGAVYPFTVTSDPSSSGASRFELVFTSPSIDQSRVLAMESNVNCGDGALTITIQNSQPGINYQFVYDGLTLNEPILGNGGAVSAVIPSPTLSSGNHSLNVLANSKDGCHTFEYSNAFEIQIEDVPVTQLVSATSACTEGSVTLVAGGAPANGFYNWYESENSATPIAGASLAEFVTPVINKTTTYYVAAVNGAGCESSERIAIQAVVNQPETPVISVQADLLKVQEGLGDYQWYLDGEIIEGATTNTYLIKKSGSYSVSASANGCSATSEGFEYIVNGSEHKSLSGYYDVFPNPVKDAFTVSGPDLDQSTISVFDHTGKEMEIESTLQEDGDGNWQFTANVAKLRNGMYLLNIQKSSQVIQLKLIKR